MAGSTLITNSVVSRHRSVFETPQKLTECYQYFDRYIISKFQFSCFCLWLIAICFDGIS